MIVPVFIDIKFILLGTLFFKDKICTEWKEEYDVDNILENDKWMLFYLRLFMCNAESHLVCL